MVLGYVVAALLLYAVILVAVAQLADILLHIHLGEPKRRTAS